MANQSIEDLLRSGQTSIGLSTDTVLAVNEITGEIGLGSCLYLKYRGKAIGISCAHLLKAGYKYFTGAARSDSPRIPRSRFDVPSFQLLARFDEQDIAFFDASNVNLQASGKALLDLERVSVPNRVTLKGKHSIIWGVPGSLAEHHKLAPDFLFSMLPIYTALGPIVTVYDELIIGDFAEREIVFNNFKDFPWLREFEPSGGARDLRGMSGSGLWLPGTPGHFLVGVLLGRADSQVGTHLIRFRPIWVVKELLDRVV